MANVTVVSKIRFLAGIAPVILLIVSPLLALALLEFGNIPSDIRDEQLAANRCGDDRPLTLLPQASFGACSRCSTKFWKLSSPYLSPLRSTPKWPAIQLGKALYQSPSRRTGTNLL